MSLDAEKITKERQSQQSNLREGASIIGANGLISSANKMPKAIRGGGGFRRVVDGTSTVSAANAMISQQQILPSGHRTV